MMRFIIAFILSFLSFAVSAQTTQILGAPNTRIATKGDMSVDSIFYLPRTLVTSRSPIQAGALRYQSSDSALYQWTGTAWRKAGGGDVDTLLLSTRAWRQKGIDSLASVRIGGSGTNLFIPQFTGTTTLGNSGIRQGANNKQYGINFTPFSDMDNLSTVIMIDSTSYWDNYNTTSLGITQNAYRSTGNQFKYITTGAASSIGITGGDIEFNTAASGTAKTNATFSKRMQLWNSGNLTLGTSHSDGSFLFDAGTGVSRVGDIVISNAALNTWNTGAAFIQLGTNASLENWNSLTMNIGQNTHRSTGGFVYSSNGAATVFGASGGAFAVSVAGSGTAGNAVNFTTPFSVLNNGRVLVNTTTDAGYQFDVAGSMRNTTGAAFATSSGQVGIGTTTPSTSFKMDVVGGDIRVREIRVGRGLADISSNVAFGNEALNSTTSATSTTGIGNGALRSVTSGIRNTAVGDVAGFNLLTSSNNVFVGFQAGNQLQTGGSNTVIGTESMYSNVAGSSNISIGAAAMYSLRTSNNVAIGNNAGRWANRSETTAADSISNSIYIGWAAYSGSKTATNEIVIGSTADGNGSNTVTIGNSSITHNYFRGEMLVGYTSDQGAFSLQANGNALINGNIRTAAPAGGTANDWRLGTVATVSPTSPNRTIEVSIGGTIYYIHAKTTND